jgi:hypothetical protein
MLVVIVRLDHGLLLPLLPVDLLAAMLPMLLRLEPVE